MIQKRLLTFSMNFILPSTLNIHLNISVFLILDGDVQEGISKAESTQLTSGRAGRLN